jgi:hypothetical protein
MYLVIERIHRKVPINKIKMKVQSPIFDKSVINYKKIFRLKQIQHLVIFLVI